MSEESGNLRTTRVKSFDPDEAASCGFGQVLVDGWPEQEGYRKQTAVCHRDDVG